MDKKPGFFDMDERLTRLSGLSNQLDGFRAAGDFEMFRSELDPPNEGVNRSVQLRCERRGR